MSALRRHRKGQSARMSRDHKIRTILGRLSGKAREDRKLALLQGGPDYINDQFMQRYALFTRWKTRRLSHA